MPQMPSQFSSLDGLNFSTVLAVSSKAEELPFSEWLTNSIFVALLVLGIVGGLAYKATQNMQIVPHKLQNFFEFIVEFLYNQVEGIVGEKVAPKAFPLLATLFIFILVANWFGLIPGVGTVGWSAHGSGTLTHVDKPLLRPPNADLNMTLGLAACAMILWALLTFKEIGVWGFIKHTFAPKGVHGWLAIVLGIFIFIPVGIIELVSIAFRPVSLSFRLFGNLFAGEKLLHTMGAMGDNLNPFFAFLSSVALPLPFYFMELLVGLLQALVFALLCAVYIRLTTTHDEEH